jgi:transaldolase
MAIIEKTAASKSGEGLFFELALEDLTWAADLFRPIHQATNGVDGWLSLEVSPKLAYDTASTVAAAKELSARAARPNLFIKIPGNREGVPAIEEAIFVGVPVNVTLLFKSLAAPHSVNTIPEKTLLALADHGEIGAMLPHDGGDAEEVLDRFTQAGVDLDALAADLQREGAAAFVKSWDDLLACLLEKSATLRQAG